MRAKVPKKLNKLRGYIGGFVNERMYARDERSYGVLLGLTMAYNLMCGQDEKITRVPEFPTTQPTQDESPSA